VAVTGGVQPYTFTSQGRGLPPGLALSSSGLISGTPVGVGVYAFTIQVNDSSNPPLEAVRNFQVSVATALSITTVSLPNAIQNSLYSQQLQAMGTGPFVWVLSAGTLPAGVSMGGNGLILGTPTAVGSQTFTVTLTDGRGSAVGREFTIVVDPPIPAFSVRTIPATLPPTQSSSIELTLATPHPSALSGTLRLTFTSTAEVPVDDPMTQFSNGLRTSTFTIPANSTTAVFPTQLTLLTGTVAGTVRLIANIDSGPADLPASTVDILATAPKITDVVATRTAGGLDVLITGYASPRRVSSVEFNFDVKVGNKTQRISLSRNVEADFGTWYRHPASAQFGSSFSFLQSFTIENGSANAIEGVTVRLSNAQGSTTSVTVQPR